MPQYLTDSTSGSIYLFSLCLLTGSFLMLRLAARQYGQQRPASDSDVQPYQSTFGILAVAPALFVLHLICLLLAPEGSPLHRFTESLGFGHWMVAWAGPALAASSAILAIIEYRRRLRPQAVLQGAFCVSLIVGLVLFGRAWPPGILALYILSLGLLMVYFELSDASSA